MLSGKPTASHCKNTTSQPPKMTHQEQQKPNTDQGTSHQRQETLRPSQGNHTRQAPQMVDPASQCQKKEPTIQKHPPHHHSEDSPHRHQASNMETGKAPITIKRAEQPNPNRQSDQKPQEMTHVHQRDHQKENQPATRRKQPSTIEEDTQALHSHTRKLIEKFKKLHPIMSSLAKALAEITDMEE